MLDRALPPSLLSLILVVSQAAAFPYDFKDNYRKQAPAPQDGPPASAQASRDPNRLPYDVAGVVGGYVLTVLIWGVLLLTIGRKMRRKALEPPKALELELHNNKPIRPSIRTAPLASPSLSARSATSWLRKFKKSDSAVQSPVIGSPTSFDQKVIDDHNQRAQADMERLYAAVMDHDEQKHASTVSVNEMEQRPMEQRPRTMERRRPSAISTTRSQHNEDDSPISPVKAIYPPDYQNGPMTAPMPHDRVRDQYPPPSPRSIVSKRSHLSATNTTSSKNARFNLKNLRISGPIQKYPGVDSDDEAHTPLSPRFYQPGAPPSPPTQQNSPTSPYDAAEELDRVQPLPLPLAILDPPLPQLRRAAAIPRHPDNGARPARRQTQSHDTQDGRAVHPVQSVYAVHAYHARHAASGEQARSQGGGEDGEGQDEGAKGGYGTEPQGDIWGCVVIRGKGMSSCI
ncbi:hypothetical protein HBH45_062090 [Parastagonospora nodorum]|nr:hypothetical protein HBH45_062090 [Parastagonospora nodorum]KAH4333934.1 hypothetical protein HBI00_042200 [Parastagonospora nodorum]KAH4832419.1 hypothetical protein HBH60_061140 [Parastagonospora nodorum]